MKVKSILKVSLFMSGVVLLASCTGAGKDNPGVQYAPNMYLSLAFDPDQVNPNFADGKTAQHPVEGTIPRGWEPFNYENTPEEYERAGKELISPLEKTEVNLEKGKKLYLNVCSHCHGDKGLADGLVVTNGGFPSPYPYNSESVKSISEGKIFFTITYGKNAMGSHASQLGPKERWLIAQYVQQLQKLPVE
jgi:mono/diheme cytochrome c family protein